MQTIIDTTDDDLKAIAEDIPTVSSPKLDGMPGGGFQPPRGQRRGSWRTWSGLITASAANALIGSDPSEADELDYSSQTALAASIWNAMNSFSTHIWGAGLLELAGDSTEEERQACCNALAGYLLARSR
jgi:hypothetical protein